MLVELTEFGPDLDSATPGLITDCSNIYHDIGGWAAAPSQTTTGLPALASDCAGGATLTLLDGATRTFAGTSTKLYEVSSSSWVDVSRVGDYSSLIPWRFSQFGNASLAVNGQAPIQQSITSGDFADISGAPSAKYIDAVSGFVMVGATIDGTYGDNQDGWWCCELNNQAGWTPSISTQSARGRIIDSPGPCTGLRRLGDDFVFYKKNAMYMGRYQGPPIIWSWERVPGEIGALSDESVILVGTVHYFLSADGFYSFDGTIPRPIGAQIKRWFTDRLNPSFTDKVKGLHDKSRSLIYWFYASTNSSTGALDECINYNYRTNKWGRSNQVVQAAFQASLSAITYDSIGTYYSTYDSLPAIAYDSSFWLSGAAGPAVIGADKILYSLSGAPGSSQLVLSYLGDDESLTTLSEIVPRYTTTPTTANCDHAGYQRVADASTMSSKTGASLFQGKFCVLRSARWHKLTLNATGPMRIRSINPKMVPRGGE